jgi:protein O-mannosyl-transferase
MSLTNARFLLLSLLAALFAAALFGLGVGGGFVLDDAHTIVDNTLIRVGTLNSNALWDAAASFHAGGGVRPLSMLTFALDYWRHGSLDAATFKTTNLFIHALTTVLMAVFVRRLLLVAGWLPQRAALCALLAALVWAIHPLQVSSVLYAVQRMQTLATLFVVLSLWCYLCLRQAQIGGRPGWPFGVLGAVSWVAALASKEDAILLPVYTLVLELTVLRFRAASAERIRGLRNTYLALTMAGTGLALFWVLPHYWSDGAYAGRDFNSVERLLTQGRVLMMYLGQIMLPLPSHMPFNYDQLTVSRNLQEPLTTVPALLAVVVLLAWASVWHARRPVFACGVLLFFTGHLLTSTIIPVEMAFEHRNHFPLIGLLLALLDLMALGWQRLDSRSRPFLTFTAVVVVILIAMAGGLRAYAWGEPVRFARHMVDISPDSPRAWLALGGVYFDLAGRKAGRDSPYLDKAITTVEEAAARTGSASAYSNIVIYKTIKGSVDQTDWNRLAARLEEVPMLPANKNILWTTLANVRAKIGLDEAQTLRVIDIIARRAELSPADHLGIGSNIYVHMSRVDAALPYFLRAAAALPSGDPNIITLREELRTQGREQWADAIDQANARSSVKKGAGAD